MGRVPYVYCPKCEGWMSRFYTRPQKEKGHYYWLPHGHVCAPCQYVVFDEVKEI